MRLHRPLRQDQPVGDLPVGQRLGEQGGDLAFPAGQRVRPIAVGGEPRRELPGGGHRAGHVQAGREVRSVRRQDRGLGPFGPAAISQQPGQAQRRQGQVGTGADDLVARQRLTQQPDGRVPVSEDLGQLAEVTG